MKKFFLLLVVTSIFGLTAPAQTSFAGQVVDVIDGRTVTVELSTGRVVVELQYIEVPEPEQPLHLMVKDHLKNLLLGKTVELRVSGLSTTTITGRIFLNDVDV